MPPLVQWVIDSFNESPIITAIIGLVALAVLLYILKNAIKIFLLIIVLAVLAIVGSYLIRGEEETNKTLKDLGQKAAEEVEERIGDRDPSEDSGGKD